MIPDNYFEMKTPQRRDALGLMSLEEINRILRSEESKRVRDRAQARIRALNTKHKRIKEKEEKKKRFIAMLNDGWPIKQARNHLGMSYALSVEARLEYDFDEQVHTEIREDKSHIFEQKPRKDRLHYHRWDSSLVINKEFFETIDEEWY